MRVPLIWCLLAFFSIGAVAQEKPSEDDSLLKPGQPGYDEAVSFAQVLDQAGVHVRKIFASKLNGFFRGVNKAAYYRTYKGVVEAIFFEDDGAEKIKATETVQGERYLYSFTGQPRPRPAGDTFDSTKPMYFLAYANAFIVIFGDRELFETLKTSLDTN
jgi:hypothetical protein